MAISDEHGDDPGRFPHVPIRFELGDVAFDAEALVDTGFDGHVVLPIEFFGGDELPRPHGYTPWQLADGSIVSVQIFFLPSVDRHDGAARCPGQPVR
jgi:hypothetical protein